MIRKTRLVILLICVVCFLIVAPLLVLYSMGDRFDFKELKITETGGIYVRTFPSAEKIIIDSKISQNPGVFSNSVFVQSLLPGSHTVLVDKTGYYNYFKTIPVKENQVTKLENILLIKKNLQFEVITDATQSPFAVPKKIAIKNSLASSTTSGRIVWLGTDGFVYQTDLANLTAKTQTAPTKLTSSPLKITKTGTYKIITGGQNIFVINNNGLLIFDAKTNSLINLYAPATDAKISPDGKNIIYFNNNNIYTSAISSVSGKPNILYISSGKISGCLWLNNDYIIFTDGNKIIISEIDSRGNTNTITLPQTIIVTPYKKIWLKNPEIFFNQQTGKLYILSGGVLVASEKITP